MLIAAQMNSLPEAGRKFIAEIIDEEFTVSFITYIEFLGYKDATKETEDFIALANVLEINKEILIALLIPNGDAAIPSIRTSLRVERHCEEP